MENKLLTIKNLSKTYPGNKVLHEVDFTVYEGEVHALVGENGAGKSTLIKMIAGAEKPDAGAEFHFFSPKEVTCARITVPEALELGVTVLYQDISLFPNLTVAENICIELHKAPVVSKRKMRKEAEEAVKRLGIELDLDAKLGEISIGKQQMTALVRAVLFQSKIIILDEPTAALSSSEVSTLYEVVENLRNMGVGIIYISHKLDEVFYLADRITVLRDGYMVSTEKAKEYDHQKLIALMVGRELRVLPMHSQSEILEEPILEVKHFTKAQKFSEINFSLKTHEILGITGLVGAGRSELAQAIFGVDPADSGEILVKGERLSIKNPADAILGGICYAPEDRRTQGLFYGQSMTKNITPVVLEKYLNKWRLLSDKKEKAEAKHYMEKLSIRPDQPEIDIAHMSGGNQQKALLARWLNAAPKVLIVDEPTNGVDIGAKMEIHRILRTLAEEGIGIVLISSDLPEILALSDRILVMQNGKIVDDVASCDATQESILAKAIMD